MAGYTNEKCLESERYYYYYYYDTCKLTIVYDHKIKYVATTLWQTNRLWAQQYCTFLTITLLIVGDIS